jgi:hypothetical protein
MNPVLLLLALAAAADPNPDGALFNQARSNMAQILISQPNYTCLETIDRSERPKPNGKFKDIDSLRFEVAYVDKRELYAWPGSKKFDETDLLDMVPEGSAIATGAFAGHAQYLFRYNIATVKIGGWIIEEGKRYARYPFNVPQNLSHYAMMRSRKDSEVVAYSGEIWVEPETARVSKIIIHADAIPKRLEIQSTLTVIEYASAKIGEREFWLPYRSTEELTSVGGRTERNVTRFSGCRAFSGESTLRFDDVPIDNTPAPQPIKVLELPQGLWFEIQVDEAIDSTKLHIGDPLPATLASDIKQKGELLFPKGSAVELRIVHIRRMTDMIGLDFAVGEVTSSTASARLYAVPSPSPRTRMAAQSATPQVQSDPRRPGLGTFYLRGSRIVLRKGFRSVWTTVAPPPKKDPQ